MPRFYSKHTEHKMTIDQQILSFLGSGTSTARDISQGIGSDPRVVQDALIALDDAGDVLMRLGYYRLSERYKAGIK